MGRSDPQQGAAVAATDGRQRPYYGRNRGRQPLQSPYFVVCRPLLNAFQPEGMSQCLWNGSEGVWAIIGWLQR